MMVFLKSSSLLLVFFFSVVLKLPAVINRVLSSNSNETSIKLLLGVECEQGYNEQENYIPIDVC